MSLHRTLLFAISPLLMLACAASATAQSDPNHPGTWLVKLESGKRYAGRIEGSSASTMLMTRRNGRLAFIKKESVESKKQVETGFRSKTFGQMKEKLQTEFGSKYQVSETPHFLVVHPPGEYKQWAEPFEELYVRFKAYFRTRGLTINEPEFPLVAVVLRTRNEFNRMLDQGNISGDHNVVGYYSIKSNRLFTYKFSNAGRSEKQNIADTLDTIIHEASHQTAFNCGIHSRLFPNPRWTSEGLATFFEADGINNYFAFPDPKSKINWERLNSLRKYYDQGKVKGKLQSLVGSDNLFRSDPLLAYAISWGLTSYLAERNPHQYVKYLERLKQQESTASISRTNRLKHFVSVFGKIALVEGGMENYINSLPKSSR